MRPRAPSLGPLRGRPGGASRPSISHAIEHIASCSRASTSFSPDSELLLLPGPSTDSSISAHSAHVDDRVLMSRMLPSSRRAVEERNVSVDEFLGRLEEEGCTLKRSTLSCSEEQTSHSDSCARS